MFVLFCISLLCVSLHHNEPDVQLHKNLRSHVYTLAADSMEGRGIGTRGLECASEYIRKYIGMLSAGSSLQSASVDSFTGPHGTKLVNISTMIPGMNHDIPRILVAAHYDHLGIAAQDSLGIVHVMNGAHDNASGVAAVLEVARILASNPEPPRRSIEFQFFTGEEVGLLGSRHYVKSRGSLRDSIFTIVNVDAIGHLGDNALISIGLMGQSALSDIVQTCAESLMLEIIESPHSYESGDHAPFLAVGIPGFQLTTGPHILMNTPEDDAGTLDYQGLGHITQFIRAVVESLAISDILLDPPEPPHSVHQDSGRSRVRFGIVPSFAFSGVGVQVQNSITGSPAENAGIREGDIIRAIDNHTIDTLGDLASALRYYVPGDSATITYFRSDTIRSDRVIFVGRHD